MAGGFNRWKDSGFRWAKPESLTADQAQRYSRHLLIPEVGEAGQHKLLKSKALLIGAGGLGSPAAFYLAAAGVGTLGIVDSDVVDATNLQRQILHSTERIGEPKADSAKATLEAINPDVTVIPYKERLTSENIDRIIGDYDVVIDGADNFPTRYLLNDASIKWRKPVVHGAIYRFEGQVTVFRPFDGPCYRCLFPEPPPPELAPSCAEAGVLGVLPGVIGTVQATAAIKRSKLDISYSGFVDQDVHHVTSKKALEAALEAVKAEVRAAGGKDAVDTPAFQDTDEPQLADFNKFAQAVGRLAANNAQLSANRIADAAITGMIKASPDCHTYYVDNSGQVRNSSGKIPTGTGAMIPAQGTSLGGPDQAGLSGKMLTGGIAYITWHEVAINGTYRITHMVKAMLDKALGQGAKARLFDLRGNVGGHGADP